MLTSIRIKVEGSRIRHVAAGQVGNDCDVIAYLVLVRPAFLRIKGVAHRYIGRPSNTGIRAVRIKQLRKEIACIVAGVVPNRIEPAIGRHCKCAEPMPLVLMVDIIVDSHRRAKG